MLHYTTNCGQYVQTDERGRNHHGPWDEVGLIFTQFAPEEGQAPFVLLAKHGQASSIEKLYVKKVAKQRQAGLDTMAHDVMIKGKFKLESLNRLIKGGSVKTFLADHGLTLPAPTFASDNTRLQSKPS